VRPAPALYIITDRRATGGRALTDVVARALEGAARAGAPRGAVAVQLREKDLEGRALLALARELRGITAAAGAALYINDRVDVALAAGADGVHLGGTSLSPSEVRRIAPDLSVAVSAHSVTDVAAVAGNAVGNLRFVVLGPIFDTPSKRKYGEPVGVRVLVDAVRFPVPILALGGVTPQNAASCLTDGARGVACIRAVLEAVDPADAVAEFFRHLIKYCKLHYVEHLT
jgi:thiamine-phosphate pyrophosphorylase